MLIYQGKSVYGGIAIGKIKIRHKNEAVIQCYHTENPEAEYERFLNAKKTAAIQLRKLQQNARLKAGEESAGIFEIHEMMMDDTDFMESIENIIRNQGMNAEYAVSVCCDSFVAMFSSMNDSYMRERASDVKDVSERLIGILSGLTNDADVLNEPAIIASEDLTPSETLQLNTSMILAFVTAKGSKNSHTAILAKMMNIPAIIGVDVFSNRFNDGKTAIVDGYSGCVYIDPEDEFLEKMKEKAQEDMTKNSLLKEMKGKETISKKGTKVKLFANIGNIKELGNVIDNDAEGIGLFRSEFIYLEKNTLPSEEEQFAIYKNAVETMNGKKVIIRTLDIGADKQVDYLGISNEENPALGLRAIRLCIKKPEIFKTQIRALLRASVYGDLSIMYPMITSIDEMYIIKKIVSECLNELSEANIPYKIPEQGIMIETPAAALIADKLAEHVSFFSIGTNDLSQYTMAIDRQNDSLDEFFNPHHDAVMKLITMTAESAHKAGIWVGICGELASDLSLTKKFLEIGIDELSVVPSRVLALRKEIRETNA